MLNRIHGWQSRCNVNDAAPVEANAHPHPPTRTHDVSLLAICRAELASTAVGATMALRMEEQSKKQRISRRTYIWKINQGRKASAAAAAGRFFVSFIDVDDGLRAYYSSTYSTLRTSTYYTCGYEISREMSECEIIAVVVC